MWEVQLINNIKMTRLVLEPKIELEVPIIINRDIVQEHRVAI